MREIVRQRILHKCKYKCVHCGCAENLEIDHIIPLSKGGRHDEVNFQVLCKACNRRKSNKVDHLKYFKYDTSPEYIEISEDWGPIYFSLPAEEGRVIIEQVFKLNEEIFSQHG